MATVQRLTPPNEGISCHAWNKDRSMLAISPNNNEIHIYETTNWTRLHTLTEHDLMVSSLDWSDVTNKIVSCSHDRNAFVWTYDDESKTWKPALVILRIDRAAIDVKWSWDGLRFAVTSGAKCVPVCTYEHANDWWVCKMIKKKFKSTVLCCSFHPTNGQLLATGCADFKCRVYSTFAADVDGTVVNAGPFSSSPGPQEFGEVYCELSSLGWIHAVAWSPSGNSLAYAGHDSTFHVATLGPVPVVRSVRLVSLPMTCLSFVSENAIIAAGHDFSPQLFVQKGEEWSFFDVIDKPATTAAPAAAATGASAARELFKSKTTRGQDAKADSDGLKTRHESAITGLSRVTPTKYATSALDGKFIIWDLPALEISMASLGL